MAALNFDQILDAFEMASFGAAGEVEAILNLETGETYFSTDGAYPEMDTHLPDDIDSGPYIVLPTKHDLHLGWGLVKRFVEQHLPDDMASVERMAGRRGAYGRLKEFLENKGQLQAWYDFERNSTAERLRAWCADEGIELQ